VLTEDLAAWRSLELDNIPFWVRNIDGGAFSFCAETRGNRADFDAMRLQMVANTRLIEWLYPKAEVIQVSPFCAWRCAADSPKFAIDWHEINDGSARAQLNQAYVASMSLDRTAKRAAVEAQHFFEVDNA